MRKFLMLAFIVLPSIVFCQATKVDLGWYIVQKNAAYTVLQPSYADVAEDPKNVDLSALPMAMGEVVICFDYKDNKYFCFDPNGRMVIFKGENSLKKAPINDVSCVGAIIQDVQLLAGTNLTTGMYVWITAQDVAKSTITITLENNKQLEIPQSSISLATKLFREFAKSETYRTVEQ